MRAKLLNVSKWIFWLCVLASPWIYQKYIKQKPPEKTPQERAQFAINMDIETAACEMIERDIFRFKESPLRFRRVSEEYLMEKAAQIVRGGVDFHTRNLKIDKSNVEVKYVPVSEKLKLIGCRDDFRTWQNFPALGEDRPSGGISDRQEYSPKGGDASNPADGGAVGGRRLALVIGNGSYSSRPLPNATNDATDISTKLIALGFDVIFKSNANLKEMRSAIREFGARLPDYDTSLVYYSGHGIEIKGSNYLIPIDADITSEDNVADSAVEMGAILTRIAVAKKRVNIVIIDACRSNDFGSRVRSAGRGGLAAVEAPAGTIIAFSTAPGQVAEDGKGRNSPYTKHLLINLNRSNIPIEKVFKDTRRSVIEETKARQVPWENTSLAEDFYLKIVLGKADKSE